MKIFTLIASLLFASVAFADHHEAEQQIKQLIAKSYVHGAFNAQNTETMRAGFHPDFAIFSADGKKMARYEIDTWIKGINERKAAKDYDPAAARIEHEITYLDVTGNSGAATVKLYRDGVLIYTDYLSFLQFEDGWKIAAKVYHGHQ